MTDAAQRCGADLKSVAMVAARQRDLEAGGEAGCPPHLVRTGRASLVSEAEIAQWLAAVPGTTVHDDLASFAAHLLQHEATARFAI